MKIAFCYTGYLRSWEHCWKNQRDNLWGADWPGNSLLSFYTYESPRIESDKDFFHPPAWTKIPKPFYDDPFGDHKFNSRKAPENTAHQTLNQWISNFVGWRLMPTGYDVYVRIRPDLKFNGPLDFSKFDYSQKNIYIPEGFDYGGICDQFAFGNYEVMNAFYSVLLTCHDLWDEGVLFHSETMQKKNLEKHGVNIVRFGSPQFDLIR